MFLLTFLSFLFLNFANASEIKGTVFNKDDPAKIDFNFIRYQEDKGDQIAAKTTYKDLFGNEVAQEEIIYKNRALVQYTLNQKQDGTIGTAKIENGKIHFKLIKDGKTKETSEDLENPAVVGDMLEPFAQLKWEEILKGETIKFRFIVVDRAETFGFKFWKEDEKTFQGKDAIVLHMKSTSFIIAAIAGTIKLTFDKQTKKLLEVDGHLPPKRKNGSSWKDYYGRLVLHHPDLAK